MNYLSTINSFWDSATMSPLPTGQVSLYMALLHVCNKSGWTEWFQASNQVISVLTGLSEAGIVRAREGLEKRKLIEFNMQLRTVCLYRIVAAGD